MTTPLDLAAVQPWLAVCGNCDAGLAVPCTHPQGDYRVPMAALLDAVARVLVACTTAEIEVAEAQEGHPPDRAVLTVEAVRRALGLEVSADPRRLWWDERETCAESQP